MQNIKYLAFYGLLIVVLVLGFLTYHWLVIFPAALVLSCAYILVKGSTWRQIMGQAELNASVVFIGVLLSQILLAGLLWGVGRLVALVVT